MVPANRGKLKYVSPRSNLARDTLTNGDHLHMALFESTLDLVKIMGVEIVSVVICWSDECIWASGMCAGAFLKRG